MDQELKKSLLGGYEALGTLLNGFKNESWTIHEAHALPGQDLKADNVRRLLSSLHDLRVALGEVLVATDGPPIRGKVSAAALEPADRQESASIG